MLWGLKKKKKERRHFPSLVMLTNHKQINKQTRKQSFLSQGSYFHFLPPSIHSSPTSHYIKIILESFTCVYIHCDGFPINKNIDSEDRWGQTDGVCSLLYTLLSLSGFSSHIHHCSKDSRLSEIRSLMQDEELGVRRRRRDALTAFINVLRCLRSSIWIINSFPADGLRRKKEQQKKQTRFI